MYMNRNNLKLFVRSSGTPGIGKLYLDCSGQIYLITTQRMSGDVFLTLRDRVRVEEMIRWDGKRRFGDCPMRSIRKGELNRAFNRILDALDDFLFCEMNV